MNNTFIFTDACEKIKDFVKTIDSSIKSEPQTTNERIGCILKRIKDKSIEIQLTSSPQRYGNRAFQQLHGFVESLSIGDGQAYLSMSFGNPVRIDYGTGHELNFLCFVFCMREMGEIKNNEVFNTLCEYFSVVRIIISKFNLEPAGSHGPWGLDDYQVLPFLFGSAEIVRDIKKIGMMANGKVFEELVDGELGCSYEYGRTLKFVESQKCKFNKTGFDKHSPFIWELHKQPWESVNKSLYDLFVEDVLAKAVVTQHFIFTKYLSNKVMRIND
ncbi:Serine/threonine-protein phosphatase 2A activator [Dictyocoela roeselum]|nr:Serine/threonine-protein phosphatase 2A activator [Dictyocoela roeselum]